MQPPSGTETALSSAPATPPAGPDAASTPLPTVPLVVPVEAARRDDSSSEQLTADEYQAWRGFLRSYQALFRALDDELEREASLPLVNYDVLVQLANAGGRLRMRDLAGRLLVSRSGATRLIDRMARDGLVDRERCSQDGRGQYAVITAAGMAALEAARPTHLRGVRQRFLSQLDDEQLLAIGAAFTRVLRELERETGDSLL